MTESFDISFDISSINDYSDVEYESDPDDRRHYSVFANDDIDEFNSDDGSDYDEEESESLESMRDELTNLGNTIKDSCHKIQDFIFEISESNKISQNEYLNNSNHMKHIFDSYQKSIHVLSNINNIISLNYEEKNIELNDAINENKQLSNLVEELKLKNETLYQKNKRLNDKNVSLNTIYTQHINNSFKKPPSNL